MTERELNALPAELASQLRHLDRKVRGLAALRGAGVVCVVLCAGIALGVLVDWLFELGVGLRVAILLGVCGAALVAALAAIVRPLVRRATSAELAALVDTSFPDLRERIESTVELADPDLPESQKGSELMRSLLMKETVRRSHGVDFGAAADGSSAFHWMLVAVVALLLVVLPFGLSKDGYALMLSRFLTPWRNLERATNLYFEVEDGDRTVARGEDVTIEAIPRWRLSPGTLPEYAWLSWKNINGETDERRMEWSAIDEAYVATLPHVFTSFDYDISAERARTRQYHIDVVERPDITELMLEVIPPAYTGRAARMLDGAIGKTEVFERSMLIFDAAFNKPVERAELIWLSDDDVQTDLAAKVADEDRVPLELNAEGTGGRLELEAHRGGPYAIVLRDDHDLASLPGVSRELVVIADAAPQVAWSGLDPAQIVNIPPIEARPGDHVPLPVRVIDDIGVAELELHIEVIQRSELLGPLASRSPQLGQPVVSHEFDLHLGDFELREGDLLSVRARGVDGRPVPAPQEGWSPARLIRINQDADPTGLQALMQQQQQMRNAIEEIRQDVQQDREQARQLETEAAQKQKENAPFERQGDVAQLAQSERDVQQRIEQLAAAFENHPLQKTIAQQTQKIADEPVERAKDHLAAAEQAGPQNPGQQRDQLRKAIGDLSTADKNLEELIKKFDELAALERDLQQIQQLAEQAERLTNDVEQFEQDHDELQRLKKQQALDEQHQRQQEQQLAERQMDLQDEQQDLTSALDHLLEERPEILEAARQQQIDQLQQLADQANELSKHQDRLAGALSREPDESARQQPPEPASTEAPEQSGAQGDSQQNNAEQKPSEAADPDAAMPQQPAEGQPPASDNDAQPTPAQRQQQLADNAARQALETARQQGSDAEASKKARQFAERALKAAEEAQRGLLNEAAKSASQAAQSATQTSEQMQRSAEPFPERMTRQSEELAQQQAEIAEQLKEASQSPPQRQAAEQQGQQQISEETSQLSQQLAQAAERLSSNPLQQQEAGERAGEASTAAEQAQQSQQQAQAQMQQVSMRQAAEPAREAARSLREASDQARQACRACTTPQQTPVPGEVGQQVADARRQLDQAGQQLQQAGEQQQASRSPQNQDGAGPSPQPGEPGQPGEAPEDGQQPGEGEGESPEQNGQQPGDGKPGEGDMPGENGQPSDAVGPAQQGKPGENGQPGENAQPSDRAGSEAMRRVAESLQQAARQMGLQPSQRAQNQGQNQQSGDAQEGADGPQGGYGARGGLSLAELEAELGRISQRNWGQLPDRVESELQLAQQKKPDGDYARLIRLYFEEVARRQSAAQGLDGDGAEAE